MVDS
ncbi:hypothetical protein D047_4325A, partial [Vibrio parahaemolyticus VPTS-2010_2]|jgi:hypothetical protein